MKLLERDEIAVPKTNVSSVGRTTVRPTAKPNLSIRARVVTRPIVRPRNDFGTRAISFVAIAGFAYFSSTLLGYVVLEHRRQATRRASDRAAYARNEVKMARESIEALTNPTLLRAWADSRGFVSAQETAAPVLPRGGNLVAQR